MLLFRAPWQDRYMMRGTITLKRVKVILLGSFTGNNAGDMAVLESIICDCSNVLRGKNGKNADSLFTGMAAATDIELVIPTLNERGLAFINEVADLQEGITISPVPISKSIRTVTVAVRRLVREFPKADYVCTTAGILFDRKIWNPFYNFVVVYTPLLWWGKLKNPRLRVIGYNVGITSSAKTIGRHVLKKCIRLHDSIYLREEKDAELLEKFKYGGKVIYSADNVFGYMKPKMHEKTGDSKKIFINLTLYGVKNKRVFTQEITRFISCLRKRYNVFFFQTSRRDLSIAEEICREVQLAREHIYYLDLMGYKEIQGLLADCDLLVGMRMHSLIFALKSCCPVIAISYSPKVRNMMQGIHLEDFLVPTDEKSLKERLLSKLPIIWGQQKNIVNHIYLEIEKRYAICNNFK